MKPTLATPPGMTSFVPSTSTRQHPISAIDMHPMRWENRRAAVPTDFDASNGSLPGALASQHYVYEKRRDSAISMSSMIPMPAPATTALTTPPAATQASATRMENLSKSILTSPRITPSLTLFISAFVHSTWHNTNLPPTPTFTHYTAHILSTTALPFSVLLLSLLLISRLKKQHPHLRGAEGSECRLLVCALMTGMKLLLDNTYTNRTWEKVCGIPVAELNVMEMEFLVQLDFNIHVSESEYYRWLQHIEHAVHNFKRSLHCPPQSAPSRPSQPPGLVLPPTHYCPSSRAPVPTFPLVM